MNPEPNAALIDAAALVAALCVLRWLALLLAGGARWGRWAARWLRRGVFVALLVPALRLASLTATESDRAPLLWAAAIAILAAGGMLALLDALLGDWIARRRAG